VSRIASIFAAANHVALIPYVTVGYPDINTTLEVVPLLAENGCDLVELGIPFSDPLADGATIQRASHQALKHGITPRLCLELTRQLRQRTHIPLVFMTYYNPVLRFGLEEFCHKCAQVGIDGLIIPDLPPEEGQELEPITGRYDLDVIYLLAPTSTEKRIELVAEKSRSFIYLVSLTGVTGTRDKLPEELEDFVARVRKKTGKPLCVGFGVSTTEHARRIARVADGVIVGSKIVQLLEEDRSLRQVCSFVKSLKSALTRKEANM
jgi:tryptophan synthase alpha chain